jgi:hypothetical protein
MKIQSKTDSSIKLPNPNTKILHCKNYTSFQDKFKRTKMIYNFKVVRYVNNTFLVLVKIIAKFYIPRL